MALGTIYMIRTSLGYRKDVRIDLWDITARHESINRYFDIGASFIYASVCPSNPR